MTETRIQRQVLDLFAFRFDVFRRRVEGLTDAEYLWEPVPGCLTVRRGDDGVFRADPVEPAWMSPHRPGTIAWRLRHVTESLDHHALAPAMFGDGLESVPPLDAPSTAAGALARLDEGWERWMGRLRAADDERLWRLPGPAARQFAQTPLLGFTLHVAAELVGHGSEIALLRDLYLWHHVSRDPLLTACLAGDREAVERCRDADPGAVGAAIERFPDAIVRVAAVGSPETVQLMVEMGFPVNGMSGGPSPVHAAAGRGDLEMARTLVELGADVTAKDPDFQQTAAGWARFFGRPEVAAYLASLSPA